jgi:hypothetical protein
MLRRDVFERWKHDPLGLNVYFREFIVSDNPYYAWLAIEVCVKHEKEFPSWLRGYLLQLRNESNRAMRRRVTCAKFSLGFLASPRIPDPETCWTPTRMSMVPPRG